MTISLSRVRGIKVGDYVFFCGGFGFWVGRLWCFVYGGRGGSSNGVRQVGFGFGWFGGRGGEVKVVMVWGHGLNSWISFLVRWGLRYRLFWFGC